MVNTQGSIESMQGGHIVSAKMRETLEALKTNKPKDRSENDRDYQIVITDMEKLLAFFEYRVVEGRR